VRLRTFRACGTRAVTRKTFDASLQTLQREYADWLSKMPTVAPEFQDAANLAAYIDWESVVAPEGTFSVLPC